MPVTKMSADRTVFSRTTTIILFTKTTSMPDNLQDEAIVKLFKCSNTFECKPRTLLGNFEDKSEKTRKVDSVDLVRSSTYLAITALFIPPKIARDQEDAKSNPRIFVYNAGISKFHHRLIPVLKLTGYQIAALSLVPEDNEKILKTLRSWEKDPSNELAKAMSDSVFAKYGSSSANAASKSKTGGEKRKSKSRGGKGKGKEASVAESEGDDDDMVMEGVSELYGGDDNSGASVGGGADVEEEPGSDAGGGQRQGGAAVAAAARFIDFEAAVSGSDSGDEEDERATNPESIFALDEEYNNRGAERRAQGRFGSLEFEGQSLDDLDELEEVLERQSTSKRAAVSEEVEVTAKRTRMYGFVGDEDVEGSEVQGDSDVRSESSASLLRALSIVQPRRAAMRAGDQIRKAADAGKRPQAQKKGSKGGKKGGK